MKTTSLLALTLFAAGSLLAADSTPKDDVTNAANVLAGQNYSWRTTAEAANNARFRGNPTEGKTEKDGYTTLSMKFGDNPAELVMHGTNCAIKTQDNGWQSSTEALADNGGNGGFNPASFIARMAKNFKLPAADAASLATDATNLTAGADGITGGLSEETVKSLIVFRRGAGGNTPTVSNAKGSVTFWLTDGKLTKYQVHLTGSVTFNGNDRDVDRTTTVEIKDVGTTTIEVPDEAKKKME